MYKDNVPYKESFELKELGFDEPCFGYQIENQKVTIQLKITNSKLDKQALEYKNYYKGILPLKVSIPTYSQCFEWFRDNYNIKFDIVAYYDEDQLPLSKTNFQKPLQKT